jgi:hypothetical protein
MRRRRPKCSNKFAERGTPIAFWHDSLGPGSGRQVGRDARRMGNVSDASQLLNVDIRPAVRDRPTAETNHEG